MLKNAANLNKSAKINIDAYMGLLVSGFIILSSINSLKDTINPLLGNVPSKEKVEKIKEKILSPKEIIEIHDLRIHSYGEQNDFVTVHAEVPDTMNIVEAHEIADIVEREFKEELKEHAENQNEPMSIYILKSVRERINKENFENAKNELFRR